jgi:phosphatidylserine/phosphatidylglycerophosphate/cardiolipin synthase-like enzyme
VDAQKRGVRVEAILDKSHRTDKYSAADFLVNSGIPTRIDAAHAIAHNKPLIIDAETVIGGSKAAQNPNAENVLFIRCAPLAARYTANWQALARHSEPYVGRGMHQWGRSGGRRRVGKIKTPRLLRCSETCPGSGEVDGRKALRNEQALVPLRSYEGLGGDY